MPMRRARLRVWMAAAEMVQDGVAEIAHWRGWEIEARDTSGTVLFTVGFDALLPAEAQGDEVQAAVESVTNEESTCAYDQAA